MSMRCSIAQAKAEFASLVARAEHGEEIIVTRNGKPVARLVPLPAENPLVLGDLEGMGIRVADDLSIPEAWVDEWEKSAGW